MTPVSVASESPTSHPSPRSVELLVAFVDLTNFMRVTLRMPDVEVFRLCQGFFQTLGTHVAGAGGTVVKPIGDAALITFPKERADAGVVALLAAKEAVDRQMQELGLPCRLIVKAHVGEVAAGEMTVGQATWSEVYGKTVNTAAVLGSRGVALTPQVFRCLSPATRRRFKKHTPPVSYIPVHESHAD